MNTLLKLVRPLIVIDCETCGLQPDARIIEIAFQVWTAEGMKKEWRSLVNPETPIPEAAIKVHGIRDEVVQRCRECEAPRSEHDKNTDGCAAFKPWPTFKQLAANLAKGFTDCDFAGKNIFFDLRRLDFEMRRAGQPWSYAGAKIIDADRLEQLGEPRHLSDLYRKHCGEPKDAHHAMADVRMTTEVIAAQLRKYGNLPRDVAKLHEAQWPGRIDADGKFRFVDGVPCFAQWGKYAGRPMREADNGYWDFILKSTFSVEVKALAAQAKLGRFPQ
jgi:DNA polymerase-3 subunit epsilon